MKQIEYKGVIVRPRLETFEKFHDDEVEQYMERWKREQKSPYFMDKDERTEEEYREYLEKWAGSERFYWDRQTHWFVFFSNGRIVRMPKRKYTEDDKKFNSRLDKIIAKVERESTTELGKFSAMMQKLIQQRIQGHGWLVYPTTYGIGLYAIYNRHFDEDKKTIDDVLNGLHVEFANEFSDAAWIYRYKISKKEANRALIASKIEQ